MKRADGLLGIVYVGFGAWCAGLRLPAVQRSSRPPSPPIGSAGASVTSVQEEAFPKHFTAPSGAGPRSWHESLLITPFVSVVEQHSEDGGQGDLRV